MRLCKLNECLLKLNRVLLFLFLDIAIFGCNVSEESMKSVLHVFGDIRPKLNLSENPQVENRSPTKVKRYLEENLFRFCVLVVDAETVKDAYDNLPERKMEYEELFKTVVDRVGKIS